MPTNLKSVHRILHGPSTGLQAILEKASVLQYINQKLMIFLGAPMSHHMVLANIREDTAVILADSSVWLSKARYQASSILQFLTVEVGLSKLKKIQFKVQPRSESMQTHSKSLSMSVDTAKILASNDIKDPDLKSAIQHLSNNFQPKV